MEEDPPPGVPEWIVTYGDMMSLLLTFFIMLVSMSELKEEGRNRAAMNGMKQSFGSQAGHSRAPGPSLQKNSAVSEIQSAGESFQGGLQRGNLDTGGPGGPNPTVQRINHGQVITLGGSVTFDQLESGLDERAKKDLDQLIRSVAKKPHRIIVRGHTFAESVRKKPPFRDQHDLSFARALSVANYLIEKNINPDRIQVSAAGDAEPRLLTRSIEERRQNRRVDVFTVESYVPPPGTTGKAGNRGASGS